MLSIRGFLVSLCFSFFAILLAPVPAAAQGLATITQSNVNTGAFTTPGGIGGTIAVTNRSLTLTAASGITNASMTSATNFPSTWYGSTGAVPSSFRVFEVNNSVVATTGSYRVTITFSTTVQNPVLLFANADSGSFDFSGTSTATGGAVSLTKLSGNNALEVSGSTVNSTTATAANAGCEDNSGGNPAGGCGQVQFNGNYNSITWVISDTNTATASGDGHGIAIFLPQQPDLAITKTDGIGTMMSGASTVYTLVVTNNGSSTVTGATLTDAAATGLLKTAIVCDSTPGACTSGTTPTIAQLQAGYILPAIAAGGIYRLAVTATATATGGSVTNTASIAPPSGGLDTVGGNDSASDTNSVTTRVAGTPPTLVCPVGTTIFDWDTVTWAAGSTSNNYAVAGFGVINFTTTISGGTFLNNTTYGGQTPVRQNVMTGGLSPAQYSLIWITDFTSQAGSTSTTITLPAVVNGAQFRLFDIDANAGQYADRATVTGSLGGVSVTPTLTNGVTNYVIGNTAYGDVVSADTSANGNVVVTFTQPIDTIVVTYGNHSAAPTDPGQQAITLHDITTCTPQANLSVTKVSSVISDPISTSNPKSIPGAVIQYCILTSNAGSATATAVTATDTIPTNLTYLAGSMLSGTSCAGATTAEDDNNTGADESDPYGASIAGTTITGVAPTLGSGISFALVFRATVN